MTKICHEILLQKRFSKRGCFNIETSTEHVHGGSLLSPLVPLQKSCVARVTHADRFGRGRKGHGVIRTRVAKDATAVTTMMLKNNKTKQNLTKCYESKTALSSSSGSNGDITQTVTCLVSINTTQKNNNNNIKRRHKGVKTTCTFRLAKENGWLHCWHWAASLSSAHFMSWKNKVQEILHQQLSFPWLRQIVLQKCFCSANCSNVSRKSTKFTLTCETVLLKLNFRDYFELLSKLRTFAPIATAHL